jgi:hypothetical protein
MLSDLESEGDVEALFAGLIKGDVVPTGAIEAWARLRREHPLFRLAMLKCRRHIEALLRGQGRPATVRCVGLMLRVLTDREASPYLDRAFHGSLERSEDYHRKAGEVDVEGLTREERDWHLTRYQVQQLYLQALERVRRRRQD